MNPSYNNGQLSGIYHQYELISVRMRKRENVWREFFKSCPTDLEITYEQENTTGETVGAIFFSERFLSCGDCTREDSISLKHYL